MPLKLPITSGTLPQWCAIWTVLYNNTVGTGSNGTCLCQSGMIWVATNKDCEANCSAVNGSTGDNIDPVTCRCTFGHSWNAATTNCDLNCSMIPFSNDTSSDGCVCVPMFNWNSTSQLCTIDCNQFPNTIYSISATSCHCKAKYIWQDGGATHDPTLLGCQQDCRYIKRAVGNGVNGTCICQHGYSWINNTCSLNCANMPWSIGANSDGDKCNCAQGALWSPNLLLCQLACYRIANTQRWDTVNGACVCRVRFTWNPQTLTCVPTVWDSDNL